MTATVRTPAAHVSQPCPTCQPTAAYVYTETEQGPNKTINVHSNEEPEEGQGSGEIIDVDSGSPIFVRQIGRPPGAGTCVGEPGGSC
ncbi:MAG: hypothetical protein HY775_03365 [Acidobacteria bacterium]|nr:hypothetical protein [Acidobacteriota bacterium]